ncbi:pantoate--beta-alanine ligase [Desulfovibrio mangrovi]|uniref:pantoate--beta-alanine ligase n=1 Tax=Desulfovibrio mangrovi TaxID=2976983 RepID=UPI0022462809|nr:pantoate--beta-alanine ligase [Desulfovibrio mangrovi]UZP68679.1 pantoate--beta-alanine ligase [Desulfovibrio mangrovi]
MQIITDPSELQNCCLTWRMQGLKTALVPTMGYFHAGHESLMACARSAADKVILTLFVNPTQFGPNEDLAAYPRDHERDIAIAKAQGVDVLFLPEAGSMYAPDHATWVEVPELAQGLCGLSRPTHFRGVCTVVMKLFMLTLPSLAVFGQKDWQQVAIIKRMVRDLNVPVQILPSPIVREHDGLALSSRNVYLTESERAQAPAIQSSLRLAKKLVSEGTMEISVLAEAIRAHWAANLPDGEEDYLSFVHPDTLAPLSRIDGPALCAVAVRLGKARLLDNILLTEGTA